MQTPGKRLPDQTKAMFKQQVLDLLLKMLGISHTKVSFASATSSFLLADSYPLQNTKVGNA